MDTEKVLRSILEKRTSLKDVDINQPLSSLGIDSLDLVEVVLEIEEQLGITFESDEIANVSSLKEIKEMIDRKIKEK